MKSKHILSELEEHRSFSEFQNKVFDIKQDNETLWRFLKYNGFNLSRAEDMLRKSIKWRKENKVSSYLNWKAPKAVSDDYKFECIGQDLDGHAVVFIPIGGWQMKKIMEMGYKEESFEFRLHLLEKLADSIRKTNKSKFTVIMDMAGLTYRKCLHYETIQFLSIVFKEFEENYPERLRACYIINTPWAFTYIYNILKHAFSSKTLDKAKIFDTNEVKWEQFLLKRLPTQVLCKVLEETDTCCNGLI